MGLITEEVEITINGNNVDYWENKGYYIQYTSVLITLFLSEF